MRTETFEAQGVNLISLGRTDYNYKTGTPLISKKLSYHPAHNRGALLEDFTYYDQTDGLAKAGLMATSKQSNARQITYEDYQFGKPSRVKSPLGSITTTGLQRLGIAENHQYQWGDPTL